MTVQEFLNYFDEFNDTTQYPDARITFWLGVAEQQITTTRWGSYADYGVALWVAHQLVLEEQALAATTTSQIPGLNTGMISGTTTGPVSASWNTQSTSIVGDGHWNLTVYGLRFRELQRAFGAGPLQIDAGSYTPWNTGFSPYIN